MTDTGKVNIHGKEYKTVALRVHEFRSTHPIETGWGILTEIHTINDQFVVVMAAIIDPDGKIVAQGHGEEKWTSSQINRTSALENCETSAVGRALAAAGLAGTEYASADEVANAISQQRARKAPSRPPRPQATPDKPGVINLPEEVSEAPVSVPPVSDDPDFAEKGKLGRAIIELHDKLAGLESTFPTLDVPALRQKSVAFLREYKSKLEVAYIEASKNSQDN